jgi:hypothetical protein
VIAAPAAASSNRRWHDRPAISIQRVSDAAAVCECWTDEDERLKSIRGTSSRTTSRRRCSHGRVCSYLPQRTLHKFVARERTQARKIQHASRADGGMPARITDIIIRDSIGSFRAPSSSTQFFACFSFSVRRSNFQPSHHDDADDNDWLHHGVTKPVAHSLEHLQFTYSWLCDPLDLRWVVLARPTDRSAATLRRPRFAASNNADVAVGVIIIISNPISRRRLRRRHGNGENFVFVV